MLDAISYIIGMAANTAAYASHFLILIFRNLLLLAFILAVLWGLYRLCLRAVRYLRGMRGEELEHGRRIPKEKPEDSSD